MTRLWRVRNFERFQHYKDRNPPWIRLYGALWRDRAFFRLPDGAKAHLIGLFSLAARLDNQIPNDPDWLAHELCASQPIDLEALAQAGFLLPVPEPAGACEASAALASGQRDARRSASDSDPGSVSGSGCDPQFSAPENPSEISAGAAQKSATTSGEPPVAPVSQKGPGADRDSHFKPGRASGWPATLELSAAMREFARRLGIDAEEEFAAWRDDCAAHARRYVDWEAAWRNRCRNAMRFGRRPPARASPSAGQIELPLKREPGAGAGGGGGPIEMALRRLREAVERETSEEKER